MHRGTALFASLCAGDAAVLLGLRPEFPALARRCADLPRWFAVAGVDRALAELTGAVLWCAAVWLGLGLLAAVASALPGHSGRTAAAACRILLPSVLRRVLAGSAGVSVLLSPALASAQAVSASAPPAHSAPAGASAPRHSDPLPAPGVPATPLPRRGAARPAPTWPTDTAAPQGRPRGATVRVHPGDSLWLLAAARLGRNATDVQITTCWPRWYALNRDVIGDDPGLITPGQVLRVPAPTSRESSPC